MKRSVGSLLVGVALCVMVGVVVAQQPPVSKPGPEHERLKAWEGDWDCVSECAQFGKSTAKATCRMGLNGFWLLMDFQGDMGGEKFTGRGSIGYDPVKKKYVTVWQDSMSPQLTVLWGEYSPDGKTYTQTGEMPGMDGKMCKVKNVVEFKGNTIVEKMFEEGKNEPMMTMTYTRRK
jgi:hypothetical protein